MKKINNSGSLKGHFFPRSIKIEYCWMLKNFHKSQSDYWYFYYFLMKINEAFLNFETQNSMNRDENFMIHSIIPLWIVARLTLTTLLYSRFIKQNQSMYQYIFKRRKEPKEPCFLPYNFESRDLSEERVVIKTGSQIIL